MRLPLSVLFAALAFTAVAAEREDLRAGVRVGMAASELPDVAYKDFVCVAPKGKELKGFADWKDCDADADHLHMMHVEANEPRQEQTLIAGHPVDLMLGFNEDGRLARIVIDTKPKVPMFMRKKAFLLGLQAKARYGADGWTCEETPLAQDEEPLGQSSIKEHCAKSLGDRRVTVDRSLFRKTGSDAKAFTSQSRVVIDWTAK